MKIDELDKRLDNEFSSVYKTKIKIKINMTT